MPLPEPKFKRKPTDPLADPAVNSLVEFPPWLKALRDSISNAIKPDDVGQIMRAQVDKAKAGDTQAAGFVLNQILRMADSPKQKVSIVQNNFYGNEKERPDTPLPAAPSKEERVEKMRRRVDAGLPIRNPADGPIEMTDEEEKEFRRSTENQLQP